MNNNKKIIICENCGKEIVTDISDTPYGSKLNFYNFYYYAHCFNCGYDTILAKEG